MALKVAVRLGQAVTLVSAPEAASTVGPAWFQAVVREACHSYPSAQVTDLFDCGNKPGQVLAALRQGLKAVRYTGPKSSRIKLMDLAQQHGARLEWGRLKALDLLYEADLEAACESWLADPEK